MAKTSSEEVTVNNNVCDGVGPSEESRRLLVDATARIPSPQCVHDEGRRLLVAYFYGASALSPQKYIYY